MELGIIIAISSFVATSVGAYFTWKGVRRRSLSGVGPEVSNLTSGNECILTQIKSKGIARVGVFRSPPFMEWEIIDGRLVPSGLYGEMLQLLCSKHSINLELVPTNLSDSVSSVERGEIDFMACILQTPERSKRVDFTAFFHSLAVGGVTLKANKQIKTAQDLQAGNWTIVVCDGEVGHEYAETILRIPKSRLVIVDTLDISDMVAYLISGRAHVALADSVSCKRFLDQCAQSKPPLKPRFRRHPLMVCQNGFMVKKNQPRLASWLDRELHLLRTEPRIREIEDDVLEEYAGLITRL